VLFAIQHRIGQAQAYSVRPLALFLNASTLELLPFISCPLHRFARIMARLEVAAPRSRWDRRAEKGLHRHWAPFHWSCRFRLHDAASPRIGVSCIDPLISRASRTLPRLLRYSGERVSCYFGSPSVVFAAAQINFSSPVHSGALISQASNRPTCFPHTFVPSHCPSILDGAAPIRTRGGKFVGRIKVSRSDSDAAGTWLRLRGARVRIDAVPRAGTASVREAAQASLPGCLRSGFMCLGKHSPSLSAAPVNLSPCSRRHQTLRQCRWARRYAHLAGESAFYSLVAACLRAAVCIAHCVLR